MNDRERLRGIENDWQEAIRAIRDEWTEDLGATQKQLAGIRRDYRRLSHRVLALCGVLLVTVVAGFASFAVQQKRVADSRRLAVSEGCVDRNRLAGGNLFFIELVAPGLEPRARAVFRLQASCRVYTDAIVDGRRPPPTVPGFPIPPVR